MADPAGSATCAAHGAPVVATCARCGLFLCSAERRELDARAYCPACVVLPEVDYLEAYRLRFFGKRRDGYSWFFLAGGLFNGAGAIGRISQPESRATLAEWIVTGIYLLLAGSQLGWFFKQRWARYALPLILLVLAVLAGVAFGPPAAAAFIVPLVVVGSAFTNLRSKLFFGLAVGRDELRQDWSRYHDNRLALVARGLGVTSVLLPPVGLVALILGVIALRRVDPTSVPPVGNRGAAIIGIVGGAIGTLFGVGLLLSVW